MEATKGYEGPEKIVISVDVGTTQSAVSYLYLYPGSVPEVKMVTKWAGQPEVMGDSKIPTILAYRNGGLVACGAEAREFVGDDDYEVAKWFKLYLHPDSMRISDQPPQYHRDSSTSGSRNIPPLPEGISLDKDGTSNGKQIWARLEESIVIVMTTPNGWDTAQQGFLREAAIVAGLVTKTNAEAQVEFVTEGEASVHYVLAHQHHTWLTEGAAFVVVDAGGSTVDSTLYECKAVEPRLVLREASVSECIQAGGIFVDNAAREMLARKLNGSPFSEEEYIEEMIQIFEKNLKRVFNGTQESNILHFGRSRDNDRERGILKGRLPLSRNEVKSTFDGVVARILDGTRRLISGRNVGHVLLVGGFGESPYLRDKLRALLAESLAEVVTVEEPSKKAAAEGASIWHIKQLVAARVARFTLGGQIRVQFNASNPSHLARRHRIQLMDGIAFLINSFDAWVEKGTVIDQTFSKNFTYCLESDFKPTVQELERFHLPVLVWEGLGIPSWTDDIAGTTLSEIRTLCMLKADAHRLAPLLKEYKTGDGKQGWKVKVNVVVRLGGVQLQARMQWKENGQICEGPITIIPNSAF